MHSISKALHGARFILPMTSPARFLAAAFVAIAIPLSLATPASASVPTSDTPARSVSAPKASSDRAPEQPPKKAHKKKAQPSVGQRIVNIAASKAGTPYRYGATGPDAFDCSGFTSWVYRQVGKQLPRTSADQRAATRRVSRPALGDLVFFHDGGRVTHVGIYAGDNHIWHSPYQGQGVKRERIWSSAVSFGRR